MFFRDDKVKISIKINLSNYGRRGKMAKEWILNMATNRWGLMGFE